MSLSILSTPLRGSSLVRIASEQTPDNSWYVRRPQSVEEWRQRAGDVRQSLLNADWLTALGPALNASGAAADRLERAAASGIAVTTGQQPGLFGGPLYCWWKALSALALADRLEEITGLPVVPVFWAATDDSDFAEAASTVVATDEGVVRIQLEPDGQDGRPLSEVRIGDVTAQLARLRSACGSAPHSSALLQVEEAYRTGRTVGGAYVALLRGVLEPMGIAVLDAAHPATLAAGFPLMRRALQESDGVGRALIERSAALKKAGHFPQVKVVKGRSLVFADNDGRRERISAKDSGKAAMNAQPGSLGPNVLLRPIVERSILPTVAYAGGPGEIAYFAQISAVAEALGVMAPLVVPRWSGFVIEPRVARILDRYGLEVDNFRDPHAVESRFARESIPSALNDRLSALDDATRQSIAAMAAAEGADIVSHSVLEGLSRDVSHRVERLRRRYSAAIKRRGNDALRDAAIARASLFPEGDPQERALNVIPLLARYGDEVFEKVLIEARAHARSLA